MLEMLSMKKTVMSYLSREMYPIADLHTDDDRTLEVKIKEPPVMPSLTLQLLGDFRLLSDNSPVTSFDLPRLQSLLAYLVLHRDAPQTRSHLAFLLWPESTDAQAYNNLRTLLYRMRHALPNADAFLRVERQDLHWSPTTGWSLDVLDFEQALAQAGSAKDSTVARQALERAVSFYRGDLLPSCYDEWIIAERDRLRQAYLGALQRLADLLEQEREYEAAISAAQRLLRQEPLHEESYRRLMRLYSVNGDRAAALRVYQSCVSTLERELGVKPDRATREAYNRLLQSDALPIEKMTVQTHHIQGAPLVGRQPEWTQLQAAWRGAMHGQPQVVVLSGEAGIGKTRLAEEMMAWVGSQGILALSARCYTSMNEMAYTPLASWLRADALRPSLLRQADVWQTEIARLVPDLLVERPQLSQPGLLRESWQQQRFFEALAHAIIGHRQPILLVLDDAQWCDRETLAWLHYLLCFEPEARLLVVVTARSEEIMPGHKLTALLTSLRRDGKVSEIALAPLTEGETATLAELIAGSALTASEAAMIYHETEGNPLFIVETVRAGLGKWASNGDVRSFGLPPSPLSPLMQAVITARLAQLSPQGRTVVNLAAVIGRSFTLPVLVQADGGDEDALVSGLDDLWQRGIVREDSDSTYIFSHEKLREEVYSNLCAAQRHLLHRRVAEALEAVYTGDPDRASQQIAAHYEYAGLRPPVLAYAGRAESELCPAC